ncbi:MULTISPECIES: hypothetical protein [unclassified Pseudomonas]|nr:MULTISPECIES: hypothetical protein [unclassified Pseudomonas]
MKRSAEAANDEKRDSNEPAMDHWRVRMKRSARSGVYYAAGFKRPLSQPE